MKKFNPIYAGIIAATTAMAPTASQAASYYYSLFQLDKVNFYGEYMHDANGNGVWDGVAGGDNYLWARPASDDTDTHKATFTVHSQSQYAPPVGPSTDDSPADQTKVLTSHVPPAGFFPLGNSAGNPPSANNESFVTINGAVKPPEDTYTQSYGTAGTYPVPPTQQFSRADSIIDTTGVNNPGFHDANGNLTAESAGETLKTVAEGAISSAGKMTSNAFAKIDAWADMGDNSLDVGAVDNLGWTGRVQLAFDYTRGLDVRTTVLGDVANAAYVLAFELDQQNADGSRSAIDVDANGDVIGLPAIFNRQTTVQDGADNRVPGGAFPGTGTFSQIWDLTGILTPNADTILRAQILINQKVDGYALSSAVVPEPATILLLGAGLVGVGRFSKRRTDASK